MRGEGDKKLTFLSSRDSTKVTHGPASEKFGGVFPPFPTQTFQPSGHLLDFSNHSEKYTLLQNTLKIGESDKGSDKGSGHWTRVMTLIPSTFYLFFHYSLMVGFVPLLAADPVWSPVRICTLFLKCYSAYIHMPSCCPRFLQS